MPKRIVIADYDINVASIQKKIDDLKVSLDSPDLGKGFSTKFTKQLQKIEQSLLKVSESTPGSGATSKQIENYNKKLLSIKNNLSNFISGLQGFEISDKYLLKNIESLQKYINKLEEANNELKKLKESSPTDYRATAEGLIDRTDEVQKEMRKAAQSGDRNKVIELYGAYSKSITADRRKVKDSNLEQYTALGIDREEVHKKEKLYIKLAEDIAKADQVVKQAEQEKARETVKANERMVSAIQGVSTVGEAVINQTEKTRNSVAAFAQDTKELENTSQSFDTIASKITNLFSATSIFYTLRRVVKGAIQDFQELDKQFNEIAIVSDYSTKEMWESFSTVNKTAQEFGVETKNVLEVQNLYYHQGKDMTEVNKLTAQTLTLAKITGMDYERATSDLTAALNAYNIAAEDAVRVTDTIAAMDTNAAISSEELMTALTKTASIAANAGMSLESTEVFLTKMIETTREAPENLGTALKTIIARFGEVKQEIDGEEIELADINRVDTALKSIGISLLDTAGQIRDLDGVFMELSSKWDDLDRNTQRYIATIAAGSRQQSRFIAMMEDYDRTLELTEIAQNSAGLGARQLAKSQESIETSVNRLKSTWQEFYSSFIKSDMIKNVLELANGTLSLVNSLNETSPALGLLVTGLTIWILKTQVLDKILTMHTLKMKVLRGEMEASSLAEEFAYAMQRKKETGLWAQIKAYMSLSKEMDKINGKINRETLSIKNNTKTWDDNTKEKKETSIKNAKTKQKKGTAKQGNKNTPASNTVSDILSSFTEKIKTSKNTNKKLSKTLSEEFQTQIENSFKTGKIGKLTSSIQGIGDRSSITGKAIGELSDALLTKGGNSAKVGTAIAKGAKATGSLGGTLAKLGPSVAKLAGFLTNPVVLGAIATIGTGLVIYNKAMGQTLDDTEKVEKLAKTQENYNKTLTEYKTLKQNIGIVQKNALKKNLTEEEFTENQEAIKALVTEYPKYLDHIDEEGNYHLKNVDALDAEIKKKQELLDMNSSQLTGLRAVYAQSGIYVDETTQAGKAMANLQDFASSMGKEQLKEIANTVDAGITGFNKDKWYEAMEAYASGEKSSFDNKDFSTLFAGDIGEESWNKILEAIAAEGSKVFDEEGNLIEEEFAKVLNETGAYLGKNADNVARAFARLSEQTGGLYANLLQGAAEEYDNIVIQNATLQIEKADLGTSNETNQALATVIADSVGDLTWGEKFVDWFAATNLGKSWQIESITQQKTADTSDKAISEFNAYTDAEIEKFDKAFTSKNIGGLTNSEIKSLEEKSGRELVLNFFNSLDEELKNDIGLSKNAIEDMSDTVLDTYSKVISSAIENYSVDKKLEKFDDIKQYLQGTDLSNFNNFTGALTTDQTNAFLSSLSSMEDYEGAHYFKGILSEINQAADSTKESLKNIFLSADVSTPQGIVSLQEDLVKLGYTGEQVTKILAKLGVLDELDVSSLDDLDRYASNVEKFSKSIESMSALLEGSGTDEQLKDFFNTMTDSWKKINPDADEQELINYLGTLNQSITATSNGYKIAEASALQYGNNAKTSLLELIKTQIDYLYTIIQTGEATIENAIAYYTLINQYSKWTAQLKQSHIDGVTKDLEKAKEKADELVDSLKTLVDWLRGYDRYANLDGVISTLKEDFEHLDFEINFSTNTDVIEKDLQEQVDNINTQIFANQGGIRAAEEEQSMWQDVINKRNSQYVSFDASGNAIVNAEKLRELQEDIADASEERKPVLQAEYDEIMDNVEAYNKAKDKVEDYSKALEENFKALEDYLKANYEAIMKVEDKLIDARMAAEDKELEKVKEKYETIKEENDKYLEDVQEMIDKEREIRDRADKEQDVKDKEKKLAMMRMDTSGIYASDIRALEKELEGDYRDLEDDAVDKAIADLEKEYQTQAEILDKEVEYLENSLEYRREIMTEYNQWAQEMMMQGSDAVIEYLKANDEEYYTGTAAAQANWTLEWNNAVAQGVAANNTMATTLDPVMRNLETCKDNANGFEGAVQQYSETALAMNPEVNSTVEELVTQYSNLARGVGEVDNAMTSLAIAYRDAADAAAALKYAQDAVITGDTYTGNYNPNISATGENGDFRENGGSNFTYYIDNANSRVQAWDANAYQATGEETDYIHSGHKLGTMVQFEYKNREKVWFKKEEVKNNKPIFGATWYKKSSSGASRAFAKGGYVDYTGPAWVDGTKSHPEYMLNATQTAQFEALVAALSNLYGNGMSSLKQSSQKIGDAYYNFHINVDQMASDYDVDQLISRLEQKMVDSSKYRNITLLKKSQ